MPKENLIPIQETFETVQETKEQIWNILGIKNQEFLQVLTEKISEYQTIIIHRHISPDGDAYGAQIGLKCIIEENWKSKKVLLAGKSGQLKGYREGIFDRLEYFQDSADKAKEEDYHDALVITVDTSSENIIDGEFWNRGKELIKIDHHPVKEPLGNFAKQENTWVEDNSPSCSQMIAKWALSQNLSIPQKASRALYHGIVTDTNRFLYISEKEDGEKTLTIAGMMLSKSNFDLLDFYKRVHPLSTVEETRVKGFIMSNFKIDNGKIWLFIKPSDFREQGWKFKRDEVISYVTSLSEIENVKVWALFVSDGVTEDGKIRASLRSESTKYPVNEVAQNFGGSGHIRAAGLKLPKDDWEQAQKVVEQLLKL